MTISGGEIRNTELQVAFDGELILNGTSIYVSDGATAPLTVESRGTATVTSTVFRSTAGVTTAATVAAGGSLTFGSSQLVGADGSADPFPCDGSTSSRHHDDPHTGPHARGSVTVASPASINTAALLVCDAVTGADHGSSPTSSKGLLCR